MKLSYSRWGNFGFQAKAAVTKRARQEIEWKGEIWQRNYFKRVLRNDKEIGDAEKYIAENPAMWELDRNNPDRRGELPRRGGSTG